MAIYAETIIKRQTKSLRRSLFWLFVILILLQATAFTGIIYFAWGESLDKWAPELVISTLFLAVGLVIALRLINSQEKKTATKIQRAVTKEMDTMLSVQNRFESLLAMTTAVGDTLNPQRLLQVALDLCETKFNEMGSTGTASAALLFDDQGLLKPVAGAGLSDQDLETALSIDEGIVARSLEKVEPTLSDQLSQDQAIANLTAFKSSRTGVCLPLRRGRDLLGFIILGSPETIPFDGDEVVLLNAIAGLTVPAIQIDQLHSRHAANMWKILKTEEAERLAMARTLRDGPAQQITGVAMRLGFIHGNLAKNPNQTLIELKQMEAESSESAKGLREIAFLLRPMLGLNEKSLDQAIREIIQRIHKIGNLQVAFSGGITDQTLADKVEIIVRYIVETALFWAQKHGRASRATVRLRFEEGVFTVRIEDNGSDDGWFLERQSRSIRDLPMIIMRERARRIDGSLDVAQGQAGGRIVTLTVPLEKYGQGHVG